MFRRLLWGIIVLSAVGAVLAGYAFAQKTGFTDGAICNINATFSCDLVNKGPYSEVAGIPVALLGLIGYVFFGIAAVLKLRTPADKQVTDFLFYSTFFGLLFTLYLTGIEAFVLKAWCVICLGSQAAMLGIFACVSRIVWLEEHPVRGFLSRFFRRSV